MRIVFMGTPPLAATILEKLTESHDVVAVYTRPDAVRGRGRKLEPSPVKALSSKLGITTFTPSSFDDNAEIDRLRELAPDVICVSAYGMILPKAVLDAPAFGCLNVHTSLLPRWRGAAPIEHAILSGDNLTGVCIMKMQEGLDTGPYCRRVELEIGDSNAQELTDALAHIGADELMGALEDIERETAEWTEQSQDGMTYASKISKGDLYPDTTDSANDFVLKVRASSLAHPARTSIADRCLAVEDATIPVDEQAAQICEALACGQAIFASKRLFAMAADGPVELLAVKPDGKRSMDAKAFAGGIQGAKNKILQWGRC